MYLKPTKDFKVNGCSSCVTYLWRKFIKIDPPWETDCEHHDHEYYFGGAADERYEADLELMKGIANRGYGWWAILVFITVRIVGHPLFPFSSRWGFGTNYFIVLKQIKKYWFPKDIEIVEYNKKTESEDIKLIKKLAEARAEKLFPKDNDIICDGKVRSTLNQLLIDKQGLNKEQVEKIKELHCKRFAVIDEMQTIVDLVSDGTLDKVRLTIDLKDLAEKVTDLEYKLQEAWGFSQDKSFHDWYEVPGCECPKMDNRERKGTKFQVTNKSCPLHGD